MIKTIVNLMSLHNKKSSTELKKRYLEYMGPIKKQLDAIESNVNFGQNLKT